MRWYEYKMEVDDLTAPDDLKAKLLAMTDTLTAEEKAEPMMAAPQTAAPAAPLNTETKKKKPIHFPVKQLGTLAACLAVCVLGYSTLHLGIGMGSAKSSAPALYAAEGAADSSAASVAAGGCDTGKQGLRNSPQCTGQRSCRGGRLSGIQQRVHAHRFQPLCKPDLPGAAGQLPEFFGRCCRCR